jgi:hypothetical protein|tara:strand:- start:1099 stop:1605 length:507 start_codon:yes stop_codon:yes gene_type:complete
MSEEENKWSQPASPPPPLFLGEKERNLVKQVNDELVERVIGQEVIYYPISLQETRFHPLYGEALAKTFLPPIRVYALVEWGGYTTRISGLGVDKRLSITVKFHRRRLTEDQDLYIREGDFVRYGDDLFEIATIDYPKQIFGQGWAGWERIFEAEASCIKAREGLFDAT